MLSRLRHPYLLLVLTTLFWSGNMVLGRAIRDQVPPLSLAFWRWAIALALVLPLALPHLRAQWPLLRAGWQAVVVLGLLGVGGYNTLAYVGLQYTPATNAVLLNSFIPIATITLSWLFLSKHLRALEWLGVLLSFAGVTAIVCRGDIATLAMLSPNIGDLWMLAAVFTWALYTIGLQWRPVGLNPMLLLAAFTLVGLPHSPRRTPGRSRRASASSFRPDRSPALPTPESFRGFSAMSSITARLLKSAPARPVCSST
jgi:drug/metabolite transporter (DMT)-like permease